MSFAEIVRTAFGNAFRSKLRTTLTILAIFVGAFTLTLTNGVGTGVTNYIDSQVASFGADDMLTVAQASLAEASAFGASSAPVEYDPDRTIMSGGMGGPGFEALTAADIEKIRATPGIISAEPLRMASPDYIEGPSGKKYEVLLNPSPAAPGVPVTAGSSIVRGDTTSNLLLPKAYLQPLGFSSDRDAVGATVTLGVSDVFGRSHVVEAQVAGVQEDTIMSFGLIISEGLTEALYNAQTTGLPPVMAMLYPAATAQVTPGTSSTEMNRIKKALEDQGYFAQSVEDQMGTIHSIVNGIVGVLNGFAIIALIAAAFGIINTLLMSVQERTREIGLMKAMGMGGRSIFALFSAEAVVIGFLGSAIGSLIAIGLGSIISSILAAGPLKDLAGLRVLEFDPVSVLVVILVVMVIAFLSGTLPATRAARLDPIEALRYE